VQNAKVLRHGDQKVPQLLKKNLASEFVWDVIPRESPCILLNIRGEKAPKQSV
jgi:hypothetical protein